MRQGRLAKADVPAPQEQSATWEACLNILRTMLVGLPLSLLPAAALAQDFPIKPIKLLVPLPSRGPNDIIARAVGQRLSDLVNQPIVSDHRDGQAERPRTDPDTKANPA